MEKRGRKRKEVPAHEEVVVVAVSEENVQLVLEELPTSTVAVAAADKKRGRKPKGGKIVTRMLDAQVTSTSVANVVLHLKCSLADLEEYQQSKLSDPLQYNPSVPPEIVSFDRNPDIFTAFEGSSQAQASSEPPPSLGQMTTTSTTTPTTTTPLTPDHAQKVKQLKIRLYKNESTKKAACFWCTYDFENDAVYIPKYMDETTVYGYGSFCGPECAVAHLMNESLDDSTKFERYHLLNRVYGKNRNIKPAPDPFYLLEKFYGNQSIQEYRTLLASNHLLYTLDKPMTRILPELHEVTDDFILGIYGGSGVATQAGGVYKVKRQSEKQQGPSKASIIRGKFGMTQS